MEEADCSEQEEDTFDSRPDDQKLVARPKSRLEIVPITEVNFRSDRFGQNGGVAMVNGTSYRNYCLFRTSVSTSPASSYRRGVAPPTFGRGLEGEEEEETRYLQLCVTDEQAAKAFFYTKAYPICCTISNFFLLLTLLAYAIVPDLRGSVVGKITMIFIFALFCSYLSISIVSFGHSPLVNRRPEGLNYSPACR